MQGPVVGRMRGIGCPTEQSGDPSSFKAGLGIKRVQLCIWFFPGFVLDRSWVPRAVPTV